MLCVWRLVSLPCVTVNGSVNLLCEPAYSLLLTDLRLHVYRTAGGAVTSNHSLAADEEMKEEMCWSRLALSCI